MEGIPEKYVELAGLRYQMQESISPMQTPVVTGYRREVSDGTDIEARQQRAKRTLVAIPCYNEEVAIGSLVLMARRYVDEVLVVDDGSTDDTVNIAREAGALVISHGSQQGKGSAVKTSLRYAFKHNFDALVFMDGDGQHNPEEIPLLLAPVLDNTADLVIGFRAMGQMPAYRRLGRAVLDVVTGAGSTITDSQCGFRALNSKSIAFMHASLKMDDFSTESEMLQIAREKQLRIDEAPIQCKYGDFDTSTKNPVSHGFEVLYSVFWLILERRPMLHISVPGFFAILLGMFLGMRSIQTYNEMGVFSIEYALFIGGLIILGIVGLLLGLMLEVVAKVRS
ncbi:glycosyltransferase (family 2) [hydrocarbon metagenome]|uniref:Glycosyltransferase (Family 2) n=1 Tax=hydrocarbon metagenome TaxID=938273 RepID=A0A0W8FJN7_9ZZZZ|nr:glycosyltransferase family 2 protein [Methanomicrobiaceae archaeon]